ncbi:outer membrane beta-barrel protein [Arsukibacterium sp.]|uniref:outer membrane beta-barrel protein n=1 Tax=Arsukibacterium sp. TaxID=1977258 RepID=UPI00299EE623|nr:outer membrane beta-barrel protein [Arsukibacterium sp.]MDX1537858.1 outer membrane beta-barrel protein [Arsukibacterium sp.]
MKLLATGLALVCVGCTTFSVTAATSPDISWNYLSVGYAKANIKNIASDDITMSGYQLGASYLLSDYLYINANYQHVSGDTIVGDILGLELEDTTYKIGLGVRQAVAKNIDSFFEAGYIRSDIGLVGFEQDSFNGLQAAAGFRYRIVHTLELSAAVRYNNGSDAENSTFGDIEVRYRITPMFDLYANYQFDSDASLLGTGVVLNF